MEDACDSEDQCVHESQYLVQYLKEGKPKRLISMASDHDSH
jgi:hypothetical protein